MKNFKSRIRCLPVVSLALLPLGAAAADIDALQTLTQGEFRLLSEDLGAALSFKPLLPAEAMGITGFDIGIAVTGTQLKNEGLLERASSGDSVSVLPVPTLRAHKGLPFNIDIGAMYGAVPDSNVRLYGGELRWAPLPGSTVVPAVAIRASFTSLTGVDQLKLQTTGLDVSISKGFANLTPYGGIGQVWVKSTPQNVPLLVEEDFTQTKVFAGLNINLGVNILFEIDNTGGITSGGVKFGLRF
ncbi:MAG TPA: hypothetical protein VFR86_26430 [Burkholderiaceae bacterium]|nr:hypothetical protein [Burkholderiaceae bacterium]